MPKPSDKPVWAIDTLFPAGLNIWSGTPTKVEPSGGKQSEGWEPGERPAAQYMNWWQNNVYQWIDYIDTGEWDDDLHVVENEYYDPVTPARFAT